MNVLCEAVVLLALAGGPSTAPAFRGSEGGDGTAQGKGALDPEASALADLKRRLETLGAGSAAGDGGEPGRRQEQERPQEPIPTELAEQGGSFIDFDWLEMQPRLGMAIFSEDYHVDASPSLGVQFRAPLTCLAPASNPTGEYFGIFAEADAMFIERTIRVDDPKGVALMLALGMDYSFFRDGTWLLMVRGGVQFATYGGVSDLQDGFAPVAGLSVGLTLSRSLSLTLCPEMVFAGAGDYIILGYAGMVIEF
jgi:hypothetical protein